MGIFDKLTGRVGEFVGDFLDEVRIPDDVHTRLEGARRAMNEGRHEDARAALERVVSQYPELARAHHMLGMSHFYRGAPQAAARSLRRAIELKEDAASHLWAGLALEQLRELRGAQDHLRRASQLSPEPPFAFELDFARGRVYLAQGRADKAIKELKKALKLKPGHPHASIALAEALVERGRAREARGAFDQIIDPPDEARTHVVDARIALAMRHDAHAGAAARAALAAPGLEPELEDEALRGAARASLASGDYADARALVERALERGRGPTRAELHAILGEVAEREHAPGARFAPLRHAPRITASDHAALEHYGRALALDPERGDALSGLGRVFLEARQLDQAADHFQRALDATRAHDPHDARVGLGLCKLSTDDVGAARQLLEETIKQRTLEGAPDAESWHALGLASLEAGDAAEALIALRHAADLATADADHAAQIEADLQRALTELRPGWRMPDALDDPSALTRVLTQLRDYTARDARLAPFLATSQELLSALDAPLSVAILGEFNAGKSTLINALVGEQIVPMGVLPTTAHTGVIQYGPRQTARVVYHDGHTKEVPFSEARKVMKTDADGIDHLDYLYPHPELRAVNYWDTPGFNALEERHERTAADALARAEAILWVMDSNQVLSQTEFDHIEGLPGGAERLLVVVNKIDRLGPPGEERDAAIAHLTEYIDEEAGEHIAGCYAISALDALRAAEAGEQAPEGDAFVAFRGHLHERLIGRAGQIKTLEGARRLATLTSELTAFQADLLARYDELGGALGGLRSWLETEGITRPSRVAREELMGLEDRVDFLLRAVVKEIDESLKAKSTLVRTTHTLSEEDREFVLELVADRFGDLLERSQERVLADAATLETAIAARVGALTPRLSLQDARTLNRRLEGLFDELRVLKLLLTERVYGRLSAQAAGQLRAAGASALDRIIAHRDETRWRAILRELLPDVRSSFLSDLLDWYETFFEATERFCERAARDIATLELEAQVRYDFSALAGLVAGDATPAPPSE